MSRRNLKKEALSYLEGKWGSVIVILLIYLAVNSLLTLTFLGSLLFSSLILMALMNCFFAGREKNIYNIQDLVTPFNENLISRIVLSLLKGVYLFLWTLLFIIPGIIKFYSYSMSEYISLKNPTYDYKQCIDKSRKLMNGHKFELFVLHLSFIGWLILSLFTFGILLLYVLPYMSATTFLFYEKIYNENKMNNTIEEIK